MIVMSILRGLRQLATYNKDAVELLSRLRELEITFENFGAILAEFEARLSEVKTQANRVEKRQYRGNEPEEGQAGSPNRPREPQDALQGWLQAPSGTVLPPEVARLLGGAVL